MEEYPEVGGENLKVVKKPWWQNWIILVAVGIILLVIFVWIFVVMLKVVDRGGGADGPPPSPPGSEKFEMSPRGVDDLDGQCTRYWESHFIGDRTCVGTLNGDVLECAC